MCAPRDGGSCPFWGAWKHIVALHNSHIMSYGTPTSTPAKDSTFHAEVPGYYLLLPSSSLLHTHTSHHHLCFHAPQKIHDPPSLGAHTHLPTGYAYQEADQHTKTHQPTSQLARLTPKLHDSEILTVLLLAITKKSVRLMYVKVF